MPTLFAIVYMTFPPTKRPADAVVVNLGICVEEPENPPLLPVVRIMTIARVPQLYNNSPRITSPIQRRLTT